MQCSVSMSARYITYSAVDDRMIRTDVLGIDMSWFDYVHFLVHVLRIVIKGNVMSYDFLNLSSAEYSVRILIGDIYQTV